MVYKHAHSSPGGLDDVAIGLVNAARDSGSNDNISVVVILFKTSLSTPDSTVESGVLLGQNTLSDKQLDELNNCHKNQINFPKPPTLNEKFNTKENELKDNVDSNGSSLLTANPHNEFHHSIMMFCEKKTSQKSSLKDSSPCIIPTAFSKGLFRQTMFYILRNSIKYMDSNLMQLALDQAMINDKNKISRKKMSRIFKLGSPGMRSMVRSSQGRTHIKHQYRMKIWKSMKGVNTMRWEGVRGK